jgi:hypothetical protein
MVLAKGSKVIISNLKLNREDYTGALAEDYTITLTSEFRRLADDFQNEVTQAIDVVGATVKSLSGGKVGFSSQFKQLTTQVWDHTEPASVSISVTFDRKSNAEKDIMSLVRDVCSLPLPQEGPEGNLIPPGPSPIEGIGLDALLGGATGTKDTYINFSIGNMKFNRYLLVKAEPTFNKFTDDSGYPISVMIAFDFISMWAATKGTTSNW